MAGKFHTDYAAYNTSSTAHMAKPASLRIVRAYAEGYQRKRNGGAIGDNPHPASSPAAIAWGSGFADRSAGRPFTHVGGP